MKLKFYIAARLERANMHNYVMSRLRDLGHEVTYDWTLDGSQKDVSVEALAERARAEKQGVLDADCVIVLLPGGRGTHVELGIALAAGKPVILWSVEETPFLPSEATSAFYHDPLITKVVCPLPGIFVPVLQFEAERRRREVEAHAAMHVIPLQTIFTPEQLGEYRVNTKLLMADFAQELQQAPLEKSCRGCKHAGADPDGPYCAHPNILPKHPSGLNLASLSSPRTREDECGKGAAWWEARE